MSQQKIAKLNVWVESANSWGELSLYINDKKYIYQLPYSAENIGREIMNFMKMGNGKKVSQYIKWLDKFLIKK